MSKEEAIAYIKELIELAKCSRYVKVELQKKEIKSIETVLGYVKELEEKIKRYEKYLDNKDKKFKEALENEYQERETDYILKQVIRDKIEEYEKRIIKMEEDDIGVGFTLGKEWSDLKAKVDVLQELLESEK